MSNFDMKGWTIVPNVANVAKQRLKQGQAVLAVTVNWLDAGLGEFLGWLGVDCLVADGEHCALTDDKLEHLIRAGDGVGIPTLVRLPFDGPTLARYQNMGARGVQVPMVTNKDAARAIVEWVKYPPIGKRGLGITRSRGYGTTKEPLSEYTARVNQDTLIVAQVEDQEGIRALPQILDTDGIDVILVGTLDLSQEFGVPGQTSHPHVLTAVDAIAGECQSHHVTMGLPVSRPDDVAAAYRRGARFLLVSLTVLLRWGVESFVAARDQVNAP
ncbi:MAG: aldolase/citrate lyase family protein [Thermaerobacter sp.]|nr:aldolase/citrate lyase family protein [Thermaerobacter sp.]